MLWIVLVRNEIETALADGSGQVDVGDLLARQQRTETIAQFVDTARACGWDARDEGDGTVGIYAGPGCDQPR